MNAQNKTNDRTVATILPVLVILLSLPAGLYGVFSLLPGSHLSWLDRVANLPGISDAIAIAWFVALLAGRYLLLVAFVLDIFLISRREIPAWLKGLATVFVVLSVLGIVLVESQARNVRH